MNVILLPSQSPLDTILRGFCLMSPLLILWTSGQQRFKIFLVNFPIPVQYHDQWILHATNSVPFNEQCSRFNLEHTLVLSFAHFSTVVYVFPAGMWPFLFWDGDSPVFCALGGTVSEGEGPAGGGYPREGQDIGRFWGRMFLNWNLS